MNNYHIYEEIGKGKYSVVYKGRKKKTIEYTAVKSLEKSRREKLLNEVKMFNGLKHPNILKFHHWYETKNHLWVILEYCPGGDLMSLIEADKKGLQEQIVLKFIKDIAQGLMYLHSKGIVYCDLKPSNILFNEYGNAKLSDLGLARRLVDMITATSTNEIEFAKRGSPFYMAPELFHDNGVYSFQSDLWALGIIAYELSTGQPPYQSESFSELVDMILNNEPKYLENSLFELIRGLIDKDPTKRWGWEKISKFLNIPLLQVPGQPHFENWVKKNSYLSRLTPTKTDIVRLSLNVHKNMLKEENQQQQYKQVERDRDVKLVNRDQEIQIGDEAREEDEEAEQEEYQSDPKESNSPNIQKPFVIKNSQPSTQSLINQSPIPGGTTPQIKKNENQDILVPIDQLFTHSSDNTVKPIIGNRDIEKSIDSIYKKESLPFQFISPDDINRLIDTEQIELHFENIYNALSNNTLSQNDKLNIANYFEQIIQSSNVANRLLNSAFVPLLIKLLRTSKLSQLKHRLCCVIGLLIRHATVIEPDVSQVGIVESMVEILNSKEMNSNRRKAAATLGEYLFYGATQMEEDPSNQFWELNQLSYNTLVKIIKNPQEDEVVKCYCIKTIENISSQSMTTGIKFAQPDLIALIINVFNTTKNEQLKISCAVSLANLLIIDNTQVEVFMQTLGLKNLTNIFFENLPRVQQAMITIFNIYLLQTLSTSDSNASVQQVASLTINKIMMEESSLLKSLVYLIDHGGHVSKGKATMALMLMIKFNMSILLSLTDKHLNFFSILNKSVTEVNEYFRQCLQHLIQQLIECVPVMVQIIGESFNDSEEPTDKLIGNQVYINVLIQYAACQCLQQNMFSAQLLPEFIKLLMKAGKFTYAQGELFQVLSKMCTNSKVLVKQQTIIIQQLKICIEFMSHQQSNEIKFNFLKFITELLSALLQEEGIYDYPHFLKVHANEINNIIISMILPQLKQLLQEPSPTPFYALKLASIILTYNAHFLPHFKKSKIIYIIVDMYNTNGNTITGHTLNIIQKLIEGSTLEEIKQLGLIEKSIINAAYYVEKRGQEWSFDDLSQIFALFTQKIISEAMKTNKLVIMPDNTLVPQAFPQDQLFFQDTLINSLPQTLAMLQGGIQNGQQYMIQYLLHLAYFYPNRLSQFRAQIFTQLLAIQVPLFNKKILKLMHWILALNEQKPFKFEKKDQILQLIDKMPKDNDKVILMASKEIPRLFQSSF
ncbi:hypothetical protein pb186bvf_001573 [Paramecium bursaria]